MRTDVSNSPKGAPPPRGHPRACPACLALGLAALLLGAFLMVAEPSGAQTQAGAPSSVALRYQSLGTPTATPACPPAWSVVPSPNLNPERDGINSLHAVAVLSVDDIWAVGDYYNTGSQSYQTLIEHWNGASWSTVPSPSFNTYNNGLSAVAAVSTNDVWAVGHSGNLAHRLIEHWDGSSWSVVPSPDPGRHDSSLLGVAAVAANDIWAVGSYTPDVMTNTYTFIQHWDGSSWSTVPSPSPGTGNFLYDVAAVSANDVWAVGSYQNSTGSAQSLFEHWNGNSWSVVPSPNVVDPHLYGLAAVSANDVWAVGGAGQTLTAHWDGSSWSVVPSPNPSPSSLNYLTSVAAVSTNDVWAVGVHALNNNFPPLTLIEHWDGSSWSVVSSPSPGTHHNHLTGVAAVSANDVWAVGQYGNTIGPDQTLVERYSELPFTDVHSSDYFYQPVRYLYCNGVISGYGDATFRPNNLSTRGQFCKVIVLAAGWATYTPPTPTFRDVPDTHPFYRYIETAYNHGIISGYGCGTSCLEFRPGNNVTRAQLCKIVVLAEGWPIYTPPTPTFSDVPTTHTFYQYIETAYRYGIISGYNCGPGCLEFRPGNNATKGQLCKIVYQAVTQP